MASASLGALLTEASGRLAAVSETPRLDAEILLAEAVGLRRAQLLASLRESRPADGFEAMVVRRLNHEPIAYILGEWEFFSIPIFCESPILVPRPETEHLVEAALEFIGGEAARVADLCTGTGCVALAIAKNAPDARVWAVDLNPKAAALASRNGEALSLTDRVTILQGDLFGPLPPDAASLDAVCANPPYVADGEWEGLPAVIRKHEDPGALLAGPEGLDCIGRIAADARTRLRPGGLLALEIGDGQYEAVRALLERYGYGRIGGRRDLGGIERIVTAIWEGG